MVTNFGPTLNILEVLHNVTTILTTEFFIFTDCCSTEVSSLLHGNLLGVKREGEELA